MNGIFYEPGDAAALARAIERLVADDGQRGRLAANAVPALDSLTDFDAMVTLRAGSSSRPPRRNGSAISPVSRAPGIVEGLAKQWKRVVAQSAPAAARDRESMARLRGGRLDKMIERNGCATDWFSDYADWVDGARHSTSDIALALLGERVARAPAAPRFALIVIRPKKRLAAIAGTRRRSRATADANACAV